MKHLQRQAKQCLLAFQLRHGKRYAGKSHWTLTHLRWLETLKLEQPVQQIVFQEYVDAVLAGTKRVRGLERMIEQAAQAAATWPAIEALMALCGVNLLTAVTIVAEIGDLTRFATAPQLMAYLGLVPSERSSGARVRRGGITKTGNSHVRRVLIEAAWAYRHAARKTAPLQRRAERTPQAVQDIAWAAQKRLRGHYRALDAKGNRGAGWSSAALAGLPAFAAWRATTSGWQKPWRACILSLSFVSCLIKP
jgi:transposase